MKSAFLAFAITCAPLLADHRAVPVGAEIEVRVNETIDSETARTGQVFSANVTRDVTDGSGVVIIPRNSDASLVIRDYSKGGATGSAEMVLDLESVRVDGRSYYVDTQGIETKSRKKGLGKNKRTGIMTGGGAALGAVIGAIAGGGKGAAIGALAGAGAGATAQVLTRGKEVRVPAESTLTFRLDQPLRLATR